jgi:hypothetical protein
MKNFQLSVPAESAETPETMMTIVMWAQICALIVLQLVETSNAACGDAKSESVCLVTERCCNGTVACLWIKNQKRDFLVPALVDILHEDRKRALGVCECREECCPVDCTVSTWSDWSGCSVSCGIGSRTRVRTIVNGGSCGGAPCDETTQNEYCDAGGCPTNCQATSWSPWTCSVSCGVGTQSRSRSIAVPEANGGSCPERASLTESQTCDWGCCPTNCIPENWSAWSVCSAPCGGSGGSQSRTRTILPALCAGSCSEVSSQSRPCNNGCCTNDCVWSRRLARGQAAR